MKVSLFFTIFLGLVSLALCHVLKSEKHNFCQDPGTYCMSKLHARRCNKVEFCQEYFSISICERGPEDYCKSELTAAICEKEVFCSTWPDNDVTAVRILKPSPWNSNDRYYYNAIYDF